MQSNDELFITDYAGWIYFSPGAARYFGDRFDLWEWCDSMALIPSKNGYFCLRDTKLGRFATWGKFANLLKSRYPAHEGYFKLTSVPVHHSEYPKNTVALVIRPKGPIDRRYTSLPIIRQSVNYGVVRGDRVTVYKLGAQLCAKRVSVLKKGPIFAVVPDRGGAFISNKSNKNGNLFYIRDAALAETMRAVNERFDFVWDQDRTVLITDQAEMYRTVQSLDDFVPVAPSVPPPPPNVRTSHWARSFTNYLFLPRGVAVENGESADIYEFGTVLAIILRPNGRFTFGELKSGRIFISSKALRRWLMQKYRQKNMKFYIAPIASQRGYFLSKRRIPGDMRFNERFTSIPTSVKKSGQSP